MIIGRESTRGKNRSCAKSAAGLSGSREIWRVIVWRTPPSVRLSASSAKRLSTEPRICRPICVSTPPSERTHSAKTRDFRNLCKCRRSLLGGPKKQAIHREIIVNKISSLMRLDFFIKFDSKRSTRKVGVRYSMHVVIRDVIDYCVWSGLMGCMLRYHRIWKPEKEQKWKKWYINFDPKSGIGVELTACWDKLMPEGVLTLFIRFEVYTEALCARLGLTSKIRSRIKYITSSDWLKY